MEEMPLTLLIARRPPACETYNAMGTVLPSPAVLTDCIYLHQKFLDGNFYLNTAFANSLRGKTRSMESKKANCLSLLHYPGLQPPLLKEGELDPDDACVGNADMRCGNGVNVRPPTAACKSAKASSLLLPPLSEGGQSGWHSCRLDFLVTFLSRKKSRKIKSVQNGTKKKDNGILSSKMLWLS